MLGSQQRLEEFGGVRGWDPSDTMMPLGPSRQGVRKSGLMGFCDPAPGDDEKVRSGVAVHTMSDGVALFAWEGCDVFFSWGALGA